MMACWTTAHLSDATSGISAWPMQCAAEADLDCHCCLPLGLCPASKRTTCKDCCRTGGRRSCFTCISQHMCHWDDQSMLLCRGWKSWSCRHPLPWGCTHQEGLRSIKCDALTAGVSFSAPLAPAWNSLAIHDEACKRARQPASRNYTVAAKPTVHLWL